MPTATASATGDATVTGTKGGTLISPSSPRRRRPGLVVTEPPLGTCLPGSAVNTAIAVNSAAPGTGGVVSVTAWGYQL